MSDLPPQPKRRRVLVPAMVMLAALLGTAIGTLFYLQEPQIKVAGPLGPQPGGIAIAVLPFANQSGEGQEFLSSGVAEGVMTALVKVPDLRVVGRESVFRGGRDADRDELIKALGAAYRVEGRVRKSGNRLQVLAQLAGADGRAIAWREIYDRPLAGIFAIEGEIANAIAMALQVPLGLSSGEPPVGRITKDEGAYEEYLRAKSLWRTGGPQSLNDAAILLERVVSREPDYPPALALLALVYEGKPGFSPALSTGVADEYAYTVAASLPKAEAAARAVIQLDPNLADGYAALGLVERDRGKFAASEDAFKQALALDSSNAIALDGYSDMLAVVARLKDALSLRQRLMLIEPYVPAFNSSSAMHLWLDAQDNAATAILRGLPLATGGPFLAETWAAAGRYNSSADTLAAMPQGNYSAETVSEAVRLLRTAPSITAAPQRLVRLNNLSWVYLHIGAPARALEFHEMVLAGGDAGVSPALLWHPAYAPVRKTDRFKAYARKAGLADYWRARGWPEFCHPATGDDFTCE